MHEFGLLADGESFMPFHPRNPKHGHLQNVELDAMAVKLDSRILLNDPFYVLFVDFLMPDIATSKLEIDRVASALGPEHV